MIRKIIALLVIGLINACQQPIKNNENDLSTNAESNGVKVSTTVIHNTSFDQQLVANGIVEAIDKSELRFKTTEQISDILVKNGQFVAKGAVIATLENSLLKNQLEKAKIDFERAKQKLQEEKINYGIPEAEENEISHKILESLKIKSGYAEAINNLENAELIYNQTILKAPFKGVVANVETKVGYHIGSSEVFCTLIDKNNLEVSFSVLESEYHFIEKGQLVSIQKFNGIDKSYAGVISEINPIVDENGLIKVKATIRESIDALFDGMHVKVIINKPVENSVVIPKEALVLRSNRKVVFKLENGLAKWTYVEVLDENSTSYALKEGLSIGDTIIVSGNINLSHDAKVNASLINSSDL